MEGFVGALKSEKTVTVAGKNYTIEKKIGEGGFSYVYLVREQSNRPKSASPQPSTSPPFALKEVRFQLPEQKERIKDEIEAFSLVKDCPNVLKLLGHEIISEPRADAKAYLLFPFHGSTVQQVIDRETVNGKGKAIIPLNRILEIALDVCTGLKAFHSLNPPRSFRDLKPANILLDEKGRAILMDLGSVTFANVTISTRKEALVLQDLCAETVTAPFRAPELFDPSVGQKISTKTDIWALGCTLYAMAYGEPPFDGSATATICGKVEFPAASDSAYPQSLRDMISSLLQNSSGLRPDIDEVIMQIESLI
ncbi:hypothetical protein HDU97_002395 [Phlyctochytrium planicorne]|nr:hypothetical protein HDU97_002395 [Phlyctochytrium planicorne]